MVSANTNKNRELRIAIGIIIFGLVLLVGGAGAAALTADNVGDPLPRSQDQIENQNVLYLKNAYAIRIIAIDQEIFPHKLWLALEKEGIKLDDAILSSGSEYSYENNSDEINLKLEAFANKDSIIVFLKDVYQSSNGEILLNFENSTLYPSDSLSSFQPTSDSVYSKRSIFKEVGIKHVSSIPYSNRQITVDDNGPADYPNIQQAIDAAKSGDTIFINNGTYYEHLSITKDNLTIIGENRGSTIVDGGGEGDIVVLLGANDNTIKGITFQNGKKLTASFPPVSGTTRVFLKENYSLLLNAIDARAFPRQAWITLSKNGTKLDDKVIVVGETYNYINNMGKLILSLKMDNAFAGTKSDYITLNNITQYSENNLDIIVQNEKALLKTGVNDDFIPLSGGVEWGLFENKTLSILDIDEIAYPRQTMLLLSKNGAPVDFKIVNADERYFYYKDGRLVLRADVEAIFGGAGVYLVKLSHVYQYSEYSPSLLLNDAMNLYIVGNPRPVKWQLFQDYSLTAMDIDPKAFPRQVWLRLTRDGLTVEDKIIQTGNDNTFYKASSKIMNLSVGEIFDGRSADLVALSKIYQYSENDPDTILLQNETHLFKFGSAVGVDWQIYENYTISFMGLDIKMSPPQVWMRMKKNGEPVDDRVIAVDQTYSYTDPSNHLIFNGKIDTIFSGNLDFLKITNAYQYSEIDGTPLILNVTRNFYPKDIDYFESSNEKFVLYENYSIIPVDISIMSWPRRLWMRLYKNDALVDEKILEQGQNYSYYNDGRKVISANLDTIFVGVTTNMIQFRDFYQYSEIDGGFLMYLEKRTMTLGPGHSQISSGIRLEDSNGNRLQYLDVLNNQFGILLSTLSNNNILNANDLSNNYNGMYIKETYSYVDGSYVGMPSSSNLIYNNNFVNNIRNGYDAYSTNRWDNGYFEGGNFWSDYTGYDVDRDGIGDIPYYLNNGRDNFPLMERWDGAIKVPVTIQVDHNFTDDPSNHIWNTIQEGIDNANENDIIYVHNGHYKENIIIYKPVTLMGENNYNTIIDGGNKGDVVYVKANNVKISGFKIINGRFEYNSYYNTNVVEIRGEVANGGFIWAPNNFAGFFYDIDDNFGTENLAITTSGLDSRTIAQNDLIYSTKGQEKVLKVVDAKYNGIGDDAALAGLEEFGAGDMASTSGYYTVIGWMAEPYVAIKAKPNKLTRLLIEQGTSPAEKKTLTVGETWDIGGGFTLTAKSIDVKTSPRQVWLTLRKDGVVKDEKVVTAGTTDSDPIYTYVEKSICGEFDVPVFVTYVDGVFAGATTDMAQFRYTWLISPSCTEVKSGDVFGSLKVVSTAPILTLKNSETTMTLSRDSTVDVMGNMKLKVADSTSLRYYPFVLRTEPGTYEVRGSVATSNGTWDNASFAGFFYDIDNDLGAEKMSITASGSNNRTIAENALTYSTSGQEKPLKVVEAKYSNASEAIADGLEEFGAGDMASNAGNFTIIGWMGEKYVAIKAKSNKLSRLLVEHGTSSSEKKTLTVGETWNIGSGYTLTAVSINAKTSPRQVMVRLSKDGVKKDEKVVTSGGTNSTPIYTYSENSLCGETDVPVLVTYVDSVFAGATTDMVQFRYTWLISDDVKEIKSEDEFGKLKVVDADQEKLVLKNNYPFSLDRGSIVNLIGDIKFKVADSEELRYYPVSIKTIPGEAWGASGINLDRSENSIISDVNILNSSIGVRLFSTINDQLVRNNISSDYISVYLIDSFHNMMNNNNLFSGAQGIKYEGYDKIHFSNSIDTSNKLNGKPIYYYFNEQNITLDGIDTNHLTIAYSSGFKIRNSAVGGDGINLYYSESNMISNNTFGNETRSFESVQATVPEPVPAPIGGGGSGGSGGGGVTRINLYYSNYNNIIVNTLLNILLDNSYRNNLTSNNASIVLYNSGNNVIDNNNASNKIMGISLLSSSNNSLVQNIVWNNLDRGIILDSSHNNTLNENSVTNNNWNGILLRFSSNNTLIDNNVTNNKYNGIELQNSHNNTLTGNIMSGNTYNLAVAGNGVSSYIQKIDTSNIVDGKPVYYLVNQEDQIIDLTGNAGYVGIINSTNITVRDLTLKNNSAGILFINVNNSKIENVTLSNNSGGIYLYNSYDNSISNSRASYNYGGIALRFSDHNTFSNNSIFKNGRGISLDSSSNNTIKENYLFYNSEGILIYWCYWCWNNEDPSSNNLIFHNNFMNNTQNAIDYSYGDMNLWNAAYPTGGNYWSDYTGEDLKSGANHDQPGSDGIGDTPYYIIGSIGAQDRYPFMQLNGWLLKDLIPTISFDKTKVDLSPQFTGTLNLTLDSAPAGLSGYNLTISLSNTSVATILSAEFPGWANLKSNSSLPGSSMWIKAADINELISSGANKVLLATLTIRGDAPGNANLLISVSGMDDDKGTQINPATVASQVEVSAGVPFPCEVCKVPTDPDGDGLYEDINGNGRKDFNDVVVFFNYLEWVAGNQPISNFDFNGNGRIDFNDIIKLFEGL